MDKIFDALASGPRRKILTYLSANSMTAGEISDRFDISKPSLSKHLNILENARLVTKEKKGQYVHYSLVRDHLTDALNGFMAEIYPVSIPIKPNRKNSAMEKSKKPVSPVKDESKITDLRSAEIEDFITEKTAGDIPPEPELKRSSEKAAVVETKPNNVTEIKKKGNLSLFD